MKILIFKFPYSSVMGGGEKHTLKLVEELRKKDFEFFLTSSCPILLKEFEKRNWHCKKTHCGKEPVTKKEVFKFPFVAPFLYLKLMWILIKYKFKYKINAIYCLSLTEKILITPFARLLRIKVFWIEHVMVNKWLTHNPLKIPYIINSRFSQIITVSNAVKNQLLKMYIPEKRIHTIYHGISPKYKLIQTEEEKKYYQSRFIVGGVSRLHKEKGIKTLILAAHKAREFIPNLHVLIVGDGPEKNDLIWLSRQLKLERYIRFVGWQDNVDEWIQHFDLMVLPTPKKESFGMVLLQAYRQKKPVIATKIGGIPEVVENGQTGILIDPDNHEMLAQAIINLERDKNWRNQLGQNGFELLQKKFTQDKMIEKYNQLFQNA